MANRTLVRLVSGGRVKFAGVAGRRVFLYVVRGSIAIEGERVAQFNLAELHDDGDVVELEANDNAVILFGHADPMQEPIAARGPFVMNTQAQLNQAFADFRAGKFNVPAG
ncbi:pirin-like C-terminal cupin domain-containing protein [Paraburkholderia fungorum]|uniref:pirin-like C-terminal cupin domain-containing protein n=1 Tax=Paraburkholderia fungorum TaxID=134537 RepID=UPI0038BB42F1